MEHSKRLQVIVKILVRVLQESCHDFTAILACSCKTVPISPTHLVPEGRVLFLEFSASGLQLIYHLLNFQISLPQLHS